MKTILLALAALALAGVAQAQTTPAPKIERVEGVVAAISDSEVTLTRADGSADKLPLIATWAVIVSKPVSVDEIKPGSYLGTTNYAKPDGTGTSTEVHVSPPGVSGPGVDFLMDAAANTTMTNGVVSTVVQAEGGRVLEVNYGTGVRKITVPPGTPVVLNTPGARDLIKPGLHVRVATYTPQGGSPRQIISVIGDAAAPK